MYRTGGGLLEAVLERDWRRVLEELKHIRPDDPERRAEYRAIELVARGLSAGDTVDPRPIITRPEGVGEAQWERLVAEARPWALLHYVNDPAAARQAFEERLARWPDEPAPAGLWVEAVYIADRLGDGDLARRALEAVREGDPEHPALGDLEGIAARRMGAAGRAM